MDFDKLDKKVESNNIYKFTKKHKQFLTIVEGVCIILLLISINAYVITDHGLKKQISENCGYTTSQYKCVCEKNFVEGWEQLQNQSFDINFTK